jgi:hypothetical protein
LEWDEQGEYDDEEHTAFNFAMDLPIFNVRATNITKLLGVYEPLGEPLEGFHSEIYKLAGLDANGEGITHMESVDSDEEEESEYSDYDDEKINRVSLIGDDEKKEELEEHEHSDAELDAEEGVSASGDEETEETELEGEEEREGSVMHN